MKNRNSCSPHSKYSASVLSDEFRDALEKFLSILHRIHPRRKEMEWYRKRDAYEYFIGPKFVHLVIGGARSLRVERETGALYNWRGRGGPYGNIFHIIESSRRGLKIRFKWGNHMFVIVRGEECEVCGSTQYVVKTVVGFRCKNCRASDGRHIAAVRSLGGTPFVNGRPFQDYIVKEKQQKQASTLRSGQGDEE